MEEKFLYHIWDEGHLSPELMTVSGKKLKIIYHGQYNTGRGPDFKNAIIEIGGEQLRGDVEIHLKTRDWQAHHHHEDQYYNRVILHVVLEHKASYTHTIREDGVLVEILMLQDKLSEDITKLLVAHETPHRRSVYCDLLSALPDDNLKSILHQAGMRRFKGKIARFNSALSMSSFDQLFYEGIFEALGYHNNKLNTLQLAQTLSLDILQEFKAEGMSKAELAAIYVCASGMLKAKTTIIDEALQHKLWQLYESQTYYARKIAIDWQFFRIRPQNHPLKRILYISDLIWENLDKGLLHHFIINTSPYADDPARHYKAFNALWQNSEIFEGNAQSIGMGVRDNIYLNILLPVLDLYYQKMAMDTRPIELLYRDFPGLQANHITRFMSGYMNENQGKLVNTKAIYQQGLLDIYHRYCNWHLCSECLKLARRD